MRMTSESIPAPLSLHFVSGPLAGRSFLIEKSSVTLGRDLANDIVVKSDLQVSRQHARLLWSDGAWIIENRSQGNTVRVNDQEVQTATVTNGSTVTLGDTTCFTVTSLDTVIANTPSNVSVVGESTPSSDARRRATDVTAPPAPPSPAPLSGEPPKRIDATQIASLTELGVPSLEITSNTHAERQQYPLTRGVTSVGRDHSNDLVIDDRIVSGQHLQIVREGKSYALIHPHPSRPRTLNGLYYQGRKIRGDQPFKKTLVNGDIFRIGDEDGTLVTIAFHDGSAISHAGAPPLKPITLGADELTIGREPDNSIVLTHPQISGRRLKQYKPRLRQRRTCHQSTSGDWRRDTLGSVSPFVRGRPSAPVRRE
jgi:pSer/pThr/pTyr-binding forkhead associated (FHA) protein